MRATGRSQDSHLCNSTEPALEQYAKDMESSILALAY